MKRWVVVAGLLLGGVVYLAKEGELPFSAARVTPTPLATLPPVRAPLTVVAEGKVVPVTHASLSFAVAGRVAKVLVAEGDAVTSGQVLLRLDSARQAARVLQVQAELAAAEARLAKLQVGATADEIAAAEASVAAARAAVESAAGAVAAAGANLAKLAAGPTTEEIAIAQRRVAEARNQLWGAQASRDSICGQVGRLTQQSDCDTAEAAVGQAEEAVRIAELELIRASSGARPEDRSVAQAALQQAQGQREAAEARLEEAEAVLSGLLAGAEPEDLAVARAEVDRVRAALELARLDMDDTALRAPFEGTVASVAVTEGEVVSPGQPVVQLGDFSTWQIETEDLTEMGVVEVSVGDPARVTIDALPGLELPGEVVRIRPIGENRLGDIVYKVVIRPRRHEPRLRWNMTAAVVIEPQGEK